MNMGRNDENFDDDHCFDLLVDGELSDAERRELLAGLDDEPGGWRRCALAFLEAQSWQEDLGAIVRPPAAKPPIAAAPRWSRGPGVLGTLVAMAASFLVALVTISVYQGMREPLGGPVAEVPGQSAAVPSPSALAEQPVEPETAEQPQPVDPQEEVYMVTLDPPGDESAPIRLPAIPRERIDDPMLTNVPVILPRDVLEALRRTGHEVRQRRELIPLPLEDGRKLVVPVDEVDVHYVGRPAL